MSQIGDIEIVKPAIFHRQALETIRSFPAEVRRELGNAIFDLQKEETLRNATVASDAGDRGGCRGNQNPGRWRKLPGILFGSIGARHFDFHAFRKKTQETAKRELILGRKRLKELMNE